MGLISSFLLPPPSRRYGLAQDWQRRFLRTRAGAAPTTVECSGPVVLEHSGMARILGLGPHVRELGYAWPLPWPRGSSFPALRTFTLQSILGRSMAPRGRAARDRLSQ
jgi:hypothetical protein